MIYVNSAPQAKKIVDKHCGGGAGKQKAYGLECMSKSWT